MITQKIRIWLNEIKEFFGKLHPIVLTLLLMFTISVPITLISSVLDKGINRENRQDISEFFRRNKVSALAFDLIVKTPLTEEIKYRLPALIISYLKPFLTLENPVVWLVIILPGLPWSEGHAVPLAALIDNLFLGWLVFKIGRLRGWLAALLVHMIINFSVFLGYAVNLLIK